MAENIGVVAVVTFGIRLKLKLSALSVVFNGRTPDVEPVETVLRIPTGTKHTTK